MAYITKDFSKVAIKEETTEGTHAAPTNSDFIAITSDGIEIDKSREALERSLMTGDRLTKKIRLSNRAVTASFGVELTANSTEGAKPGYSEVLESLGFKNSTGLAAEDTILSGSTSSVIKVADASIYAKNDIIKIKEPGAHHVSPITAVDTVADTITLLVPMSSAPTAGSKIAKSIVYKLDKTQNKTLSITRIFEGDQVEERATGCRTESISLKDFSVGKIPQLSVKLSGLKFTDILNPTSFVPAFSDAEPAYVHLACMYKNATKIAVSDIGLSVEQSVNKIKTTCAENGAVSSRGTGKFKVQATFNPYKDQADLGFTLDDSSYSLFWSVANPTNSDNTEFANDIAFFIPKAKSSAIKVADVDGVHTDAVTAEGVPSDESEGIVIAFF